MKNSTLQDYLNQSFCKFRDNLAIEYGNKGITYGALDKRTQRIANGLINRGIKKETFIGILIENRLEFICAMIGILKIGGVFVPLDCSHPKDRVKRMIRSIALKYVICDSFDSRQFTSNDTNTTSDLPVKFIPIEELTAEGNSSSFIDNPGIHYSPRDKIYTYFTSGTTGIPKAIIGKNKSLFHFINWEIETFNINESFRISQFTTPGFDAFLRDIFTPLCSGGVICIPGSKEILMDSDKLIRWIDGSRIDLIHCVPGLFRLFNNNGFTKKNFENLKFVLMSGEKVESSDFINWFAIFNDRIKLVNLWGTSETTLAKTYHFISRSDMDRQRIPVGKPIRGARVVVLDRKMRVCKKRVAGELYIRTPYRTFGYCNEPELTNQGFIPNPLSNNPGDLLHRTGDWGRLLADGSIELLGRTDRQVKIRSIRIELEEIENVLVKHPSVKEAVVIKIETSNHNELLCAYFTCSEKNELEGKSLISNLYEYLSKKMPDYMVPADIFKAEEIPRNSNGKIDYTKLADMFKDKETPYIPPRNDLEKRLAGLWTEILGIEKVSVKKSFFELGGNSLNIMTLISRIHKVFDIRLSLGEIFNNATVEKQAEILIKVKKKDKYKLIELAEKKEYYKLSSAQKRLYILQHLDSKSTAYNMLMVLKLEGELEKEKFEKIFRQLVRRHESFRTSFKMVEGDPVQEVQVPGETVFSIDYHKSDKENLGEIIKHFTKPFDLGQPPVLRVGLIELEGLKHSRVLMVDMHHIICDGISLALIINEFMALYEEKALPPLTIQYKDFSQWQNYTKQRGWLKQQENYWLKKFEQEPPILNLPLDYARPPQQSFAGEFLDFWITEEITLRLNELALQHGGSIFMVLLAIVNILLSKLSKSEDIVVGTGTNGRTHDDLNNIIGMFVNTVALRNFPRAQLTFKQFLEELKENNLKDFSNQNYQFEDIVEKLGFKRDTSRNPLFDVMFQLNNYELPKITIPGLDLSPYGYRRRSSKFDFTLWATEHPELKGLHLSFEYGTKLFKKETIQQFIQYFNEIVSSIIADPDRELREIIKIPEKRKKEILLRMNQAIETEVLRMKKKNQVLQHRLIDNLERFANKIAIEYGNSSLTYGEVARHSHRIVRHLAARGVTPGTFIGVLMSDRMKLICAAVGILEAGAVFVPLDMDHPVKRLELMIESTGIKFLLANSQDFTPQKAELILLDNSDFTGDEYSPLAPLPNVHYKPEDRIYVYFTSGTTGTPQAILGKNLGLTHFVDWEIETFAIDEQFRFSQLVSPGFDAFLRDVFTPLCCGGTICVPTNKEIFSEGEKLADWFERSGVYLVSCVPSVFRLLASAHLTPGDLKNLRVILFSGERIRPFDLERWFSVFARRIRLVNLWGTSETTLAKTYHMINEGDLKRERIPVGRPITGAAVMVLDQDLEICDQLVIGDLYIRTPFRTFGYYNNSQLNHREFIRNPFSDDPEDWLHRTGDRGRILPDGSIDFLGRTDRQVKIRGIRVELEEIEKTLLKHSRVKEAVVIKKTLSTGHELLNAFIVARWEGTATEPFINEVKGYLSSTLPGCMIPANILVLGKIPTTPNGKIDYKALAVFESRPAAYAPPTNEIERYLTQLWSDILKQEKISIKDNFFVLGGNSLNIITLISRIHRDLKVKLRLGDIFKNTSIEKQAVLVNQAKRTEHISITPIEVREYYHLSSAQKRVYISHRTNPETQAYNMSTVLSLEGEVDIGKMEMVFQALIERHESLRTSFVMAAEGPVQKIHNQVEFKIDCYDLTPKEAKECEREGQPAISIIRNFIRPFDLSCAPLLRGGLIKKEENKYILIIDMHHIIADGVTYNIIIKDLLNLYEGKELSQLEVQYKDFSQWQNRGLDSGWLKQQGEYWLNRFKGEITVLELPTDYPRPPLQSFKGETITTEIDENLTRKLKAAADQHEVTFYMITLAIYNILLSKYTGQNDIIVGTPTAGRRHADLEKIVGVFVNVLLMRNTIEENHTFTQFLEEVKHNTLQAFDNQDYPFDYLTTQLDIKRLPGRNPLYEVIFAQGVQADQEFSIPGLQLKPFDEYDRHTLKTDLRLGVMEINNKINLALTYSTALFERETVENMLRHYKEILEQVVTNKAVEIKDILISHDLLTLKLHALRRDDEKGEFSFL
jgi:amino acid adenylation domain-containing protein